MTSSKVLRNCAIMPVQLRNYIYGFFLKMDLDDPAQLRNELSRLYRALEESESKTKQLQKTNEKLKTDLEIYS